MEITHIIIILVAGLVAGFVNAVSAAGSLITLPAFIFAGLTAGEANATNRVAVLFQNLFSAYGFKSKGLKLEPYMAWLAAAAMPGAVLGAFLALKIPDAIFNKILSGVMLLFLVLTLTNPLKSVIGTKERMGLKHKIIGVVVFFFIGIYGGIIQAGTGFFLMAGGLIIHQFGIVKTNHYKVVIMFAYTIAAFLVFLFKGNINWFYGLLMSGGTSLGAYVGSRWSVTANEKWLKIFMVTMIVAMSVYLWFFK